MVGAVVNIKLQSQFISFLLEVIVGEVVISRNNGELVVSSRKKVGEGVVVGTTKMIVLIVVVSVNVSLSPGFQKPSNNEWLNYCFFCC